MIEKVKKDPLHTKRLPSKWSLDKNWNVNSLDAFFPISDLNFVQFRSEQDGTYTVTMVIGSFVTGRLFGKNKAGARKFSKMLIKWKQQYQQTMRKVYDKRNSSVEQIVKLQKKLTKNCHE